MLRIWDLLKGLLNLYTVIQQPEDYDVIVVGAGAGGCPLAETMAQGGLRVALLERGGEQVDSSKMLLTSIKALRDDCAESLRSADGITVTTGNCMGGATSVNHGIYVQEQPEWVQAATSMDGVSTLTIDEIVAAYDWVRTRVAPEPTVEKPGSPGERYTQDLINVYGNRSDFTLANVTGQYQVAPNGVWRTHSTFHPTTMRRRSSDTVLDRNNTNLEVRTNAKVTRILFDGDAGIPRGFVVSATDVPQARCVELSSLEVLCVKPGGRIYISAGAIHTPALLLRSGIGPNGAVVNNSHVGQNLVDKPAMLIAASFQPGFDTTEHALFAHIAATQEGPYGTQLYEDLNLGVDALLTLAAWQRNFVPTSLRKTYVAEAAVRMIDFCETQNLATDPTPNMLCNSITPLIKAGCYKNIFGLACLIGEPTSRGTVTVNSMGQAQVNVNYLSTDHDLAGFGASVRTGFGLVPSITGAAAPQRPCSDPSNATCHSQSCPDLIADYVKFTKNSLRLAMPRHAYKMKVAPASVVYPQFVERFLANATLDDLSFGRLIRDEIFAAHHFAGSSSIGTVVDSSRSFAVMGVAGLHVVDASMLPTTPRANPMATVMALGHIAGLQAVAEMTS